MYIIKASLLNNGVKENRFFGGLTISLRKDTMSIYVPNWWSDKKLAQKFYDIEEVNKMIAFLSNYATTNFKILKTR